MKNKLKIGQVICWAGTEAVLIRVSGKEICIQLDDGRTKWVPVGMLEYYN